MSLKILRQGQMGAGPSKKEEEEETKLSLVPMASGDEKVVKAEGQDDGPSTAGSGLLETLQSHVDDLRSLTTCKVCIKSFYEPYTLSCGHTFCYTCLSQWFTTQRRKKTCPDCRASIVTQPAPAYLVKELTQVFTSRSELLSEGETTDQHRVWQQEEALAVDTDKKNTHVLRGGLFKGAFKANLHPIQLHRIRRELLDRPNGPIRDVEDGVDRCPLCAWELEDGACAGCGFGHGEPSFSDISDSDITGTEDLDAELDEGFDTETDMEEMERDLEQELEDYDLEQDMREEMRQAMRMRAARLPGRGPVRFLSSPEPESHAAFSDIDDDEEPRASDEESDDTGSLQEFIDDNVNASQSTAAALDNPTSDDASSDSDIASHLPAASTQRRIRRIDDSDDSPDSDSDSDTETDSDSSSDGDTTVRQSPPSVGTQTMPLQAGGPSRRSPIAIHEHFSDSDDEDVQPARRRRLNSAGGVLPLLNRAATDPNGFQAPIMAMNNTVRAIANTIRPLSRIPAPRHRITQSSSRSPPSHSRNRLTRTNSTGVSSRPRPAMYGPPSHIPPFRDPTIRRRPPPRVTDEQLPVHLSSSDTEPSPMHMRSVNFNNFRPPQHPTPNPMSLGQPRLLQTRNLEAPFHPGLRSHGPPALSFGSGTRSSPVTLSSPRNRS